MRMVLLDSFSLKCRTSFKVLVLVTLLITVAVEWLEYALLPLIYWPPFSASLKTPLKILVVGDPQLLGYRYSFPGILGFICRWDADRYISKTFSYALDYSKPDIVVFLGDNLDEGEIATDEEFALYVKRFQSVFRKVDFNKAIFIPGDNDIGGEDEPPPPELEERFNKYFRDDVFIPFSFLEFVKVNHITRSNKYLVAPNISDDAIRIVLSHIPLTTLYNSFVSRVFPDLKPHIILSAHDHTSSAWNAQKQTGVLLQDSPVSSGDSYSFKASENITHEIKVPTCSYRMGTDRMGYGVLQISPSGDGFYTVLWLPSRFRQLFMYLCIIIGLIFYFLIFFTRTSCKFLVR